MTSLKVAIDARGATVGAKEFDRGANKIVRTSDKVDNKLSGMASSIKTAFAGIGLGLIAKQAIGIARSFEDASAILRTVTGDIGSEFDDLQFKARELGATTRYTAGQVIEGMTSLGRMGFDSTEIDKAIESTLSLSTAFNMDLATASDIAATTIRQFGLNANETIRVVDSLTHTANNSGTTIQFLSESLKLAAPSAKLLNQDIETVSAAIGVLGDSGLRGSIAGTQLNMMFTKMGKIVPSAERALHKLGLVQEDLSLENQSLADVMNIVYGRMDRLRTQQEKLAVATDIFGIRSAKAALILGEHSDKLREYTQANKDATGETKIAADIIEGTLTGSLLSLKSAWEELLLSFEKNDFLKSIVDGATDVIRGLAGMEDKIEGNYDATMKLVTGIKLLGGVMAIVVASKITLTIISMTQAMLAATTASIALNTTLGLSVAVLGVLAAAFAGFEIGSYLNKEFKIVPEITQDVISYFKKMWIEIKMLGKDGATILKYGWQEYSNYVKQLAIDILGFFNSDFTQKIADSWNVLVAGMKTTWSTVKSVVLNIAGAMLSELGKMFDEYFKTISSQMKRAVHSLNKYYVISDDAADTLRGQIKDMKGVGDELVKIGDELKNVKAEIFTPEESKIGENIVELQKQLTDSMKPAIDIQAELLKTQVERNQALSLEKEIRADIQKEIEKEFKGKDRKGISFTDSMTDDLEVAMNKVSNLFDDGIKKIRKKRPDKNKSSTVKTQTDSVAEEIVPTDYFDRVSDSFKTLGKEMTSFKDAALGIGDAFAQSFEDVILGAQSGKEALKSFFQFVMQETIKMMVTQQISRFVGASIGSMMPSNAGAAVSANAKGNVFNNGNIQAFARGGVVSSPTLFPMRNGMGLMGEAGSEAVMPLKRGRDGKLGVSSSGSVNNSKNMNVNLTVVTNDADSFKRSKRQTLNAISNAQRRMN